MGTLHEGQYTFMIISQSILLIMRNVSDKSCRGNQNTHFMFNNFLLQLCHLWDFVEKYWAAGQATDDNIIQCMRTACSTPTAEAANTLRICNTYCFATVTMVAWTSSNFILHVHCLSCSELTLLFPN
jgi:hypothetical protein